VHGETVLHGLALLSSMAWLRGLADLLRSRMEGRVDKACCGRTGCSLIVGAPCPLPAVKNPLRDRTGQLRLGMVKHNLHGKLQ